jgi:hypothetical protein
MTELKVPDSSPEHLVAKAALIEARERLEVLKHEVERLAHNERILRPTCPRCKCKAGTGTIEELCCGGDYETVACPLCCRREYLGW